MSAFQTEMSKSYVTIAVLKLFDVNDRKYLLKLQNGNEISVIDQIQNYGILEEKLKELLALFSEDQDFARMLNKKLINSIYTLGS